MKMKPKILEERSPEILESLGPVNDVLNQDEAENP